MSPALACSQLPLRLLKFDGNLLLSKSLQGVMRCRVLCALDYQGAPPMVYSFVNALARSWLGVLQI